MARWAYVFLALAPVLTPPMEAARAPGGPIGNSTIDHAAAEMNSKSAGGPSDSTAIQPTNQPSQEELILNLMRPERVAKIDLAPDGRHLAFVAVDKYRVRLIIVDFDHLENPASMDIGEGSWWRQMMGANWNAPRVTFLRWATASRLIFAEGDNAIYAVNADGKGLTKLIAAADVGVVKGPDISSLAETPPPGMPLPPNQLDQMAGSPSTNMDPALRVAGPYSGPAITTPAITQNLDMADPRSNSYINNGSSPDRATDPTAVLGGGNQADLPSDLIPRTPRVIAMPPEDPEHIIVEGSGVQDPLSGLYYDGLFKVDIESGARVPLGEAKLPGHQFMYDQAGRLRIVLGSISHTYLHVFPGRAMWRSAKPLDKLVRDPANRGFEAKPETFFGAHAIPIGFDYNPDILYYASNQGRDTMGLYSIDLKSGEKTGFSVESPDSDVVDPSLAGSPEGPGESVDPLVFDRHLRQLVGVRVAGFAPSTRWFDSGLAQIQTRLEQKFADRTVKLLQWDDRRTRFLALVTGPMDPGRFYVYTPAGEQLVLCARRAPWIPSSSACRTSSLVFSAGDGTLLTGSVTEARNSRIHPPPLVVLCPDGPGYAPLSADFDRDAQAFAGMGFAVLRVNYRGTGGLGLKHLGSVRNGIDRVPLGDIVSAIDSIRAQTPIDPKRIAIVGEGFGGYLALRAVQIYPERFRCAVAIRAPVNLGQWVREPDLIANTRARSEDAAAFQTIIAEQNAGNPLLTLDALHATVNQPPPAPPSEDTPELFLAKARIAFFGNDRKAFEAISPSRSPDDLNRPIFLIQDDTADSGFLVSAGALRSAIEKRGGQADLITIHGRLEDMDAGDHAKVLAQIEAFLNIDFYTYDVEIGAVKTKE